MQRRRKPAAPGHGAMASDVDDGHAVEGEGPGTAAARWTSTQRRIPLTGADGQPVLLDDLPAHGPECEPGRRRYPAASTLLNRAEFRPVQVYCCYQRDDWYLGSFMNPLALVRPDERTLENRLFTSVEPAAKMFDHDRRGRWK